MLKYGKEILIAPIATQYSTCTCTCKVLYSNRVQYTVNVSGAECRIILSIPNMDRHSSLYKWYTCTCTCIYNIPHLLLLLLVVTPSLPL